MIKSESSLNKFKKISFIILMGCLIAIFFSSFDIIMVKTRDVKRRADIKNIMKALDIYYDKYQKYPDSIDEWQGWDISIAYKDIESNFLKELITEKIISNYILDPINNSNFYYRYQYFPSGSYGCDKAFYILQVINFELPNKKFGAGACPEIDFAKLIPNGYTVQEFN